MGNNSLGRRPPRVCLVGTAPPRRCGIATFTDDLRAGLSRLDPPTPALQVALTDDMDLYTYGPAVEYEIHADRLTDYAAAAAFIEQSEVDVVCLQHEFGIFGGPAGGYVNELLDRIRVPVVTSLHTVLADPPEHLRDATRALAARSDRLVVLAEQAVDLLIDGYGIDRDKVVYIPHGVPDVAFMDPEHAKPAIGAEGRVVLMTFGLLGPDKGIETMLDALQAVVAAHPEVLYIVLGATHPQVRRHDGERYRDSLAAHVDRLGLADHVVFHDRYVDLDELCRFLGATDLYVTPYLKADQIVSGTLAYAVGMGRGVVSTPYRYARELLAEGRGRLVPFGAPDALATALVDLIGDRETRNEMRRRAYDFGRSMSWPEVARTYTDLFTEVVAQSKRRVQPAPVLAAGGANFAYLRELTDDTGLIQHTRYGVADRASGYCTDDVSRALVAATIGSDRGNPVAASLIPTYLSFLSAAQREDGSFENILDFDRRFRPGTASEDTLGQVTWGLGTVIGVSDDACWRSLALQLFDRSLEAVGELTDTRAVAYAISGLCAYLARFPGTQAVRRVTQRLAAHLLRQLDDHATPDWQWFGPSLTYANAKVPHALLLASRVFDDTRLRSAGLSTLDFVLGVTFTGGQFDFIGNEGWYAKGGHRAVFGQQPIEAGLTAEACMTAYEITGDDRYLDLAQAAVQWLLGRNRLGEALYEPSSGRCRDGLDHQGVSDNFGAESAICALLGLLAVPATQVGRVASDGDDWLPLAAAD